MGTSNSTETVKEVEWSSPTAKDDGKRLAELEFNQTIDNKNAEQRQAELKLRCQEMCKQLNSYRVGQKLSLEKKFDLTGLRSTNFVLIGPTGAGKSSLIGLAELIFTGQMSVELQDSGREGTMHLETYFDGKGFKIYDSRGFFDVDESITEELKMILNGQIKPGTVIERQGLQSTIGTQYKEDYEAPLTDIIHAMVIIVNVQDPRIEQYIRKMKTLKEYCANKGLETVCVFISNNADKIGQSSEVRRLASTMGAAADRVFSVLNHIAMKSTDNMKTDYESQWNILQVIDTAVLAGERYIKYKKQLELNDIMKSSITDANINKSVAQIFEEICQEHAVPGHRLQEFSEYLESENVNTIMTLKDVLDDLDPYRMPSTTIQGWIKEKLGLAI